MVWFWGILAASVLLLVVLGYLAHRFVVRNYLPPTIRIFQEKPLFIIPFGQPTADAEDVAFPTTNNLMLRGCYLKACGPRKGVILFGPEFGSNRWSCVPYCEFLRDEGFDVFSFEVRNQGDSDCMPGYDPLQWVTDYEVQDFRAALAYLKHRDDADPRGVGLFGISKGGSAGILAAAKDPYLRCIVTDGVFAAHSTMVPYMQKWVLIYCRSSRIVRAVPGWYYRLMGLIAIRRTEKQRHCHFPHLEHAMHRLSPRPLLMIHGGGDTYIKPDMARALFDLAEEPKEFWLVNRAKHNQAFQLANGQYKQRVLSFFETHLAAPRRPVVHSGNGTSTIELTPLAAMVKPSYKF